MNKTILKALLIVTIFISYSCQKRQDFKMANNLTELNTTILDNQELLGVVNFEPFFHKREKHSKRYLRFGLIVLDNNNLSLTSLFEIEKAVLDQYNLLYSFEDIWIDSNQNVTICLDNQFDFVFEDSCVRTEKFLMDYSSHVYGELLKYKGNEYYFFDSIPKIIFQQDSMLNCLSDDKNFNYWNNRKYRNSLDGNKKNEIWHFSYYPEQNLIIYENYISRVYF